MEGAALVTVHLAERMTALEYIRYNYYTTGFRPIKMP
jgi:hypothetical protein